MEMQEKNENWFHFNIDGRVKGIWRNSDRGIANTNVDN